MAVITKDVKAMGAPGQRHANIDKGQDRER